MLRDYQQAGVEAFFKRLMSGPGNTLLGYPTGTGKSRIIAGITATALSTWFGSRVLVVTHSQELVQQNFDALIGEWPTAPAGIFSAGIGRKDYFAPVTFAGIGSIANSLDELGHWDLVLIDEAHAVPHKEETVYRQTLERIRWRNPNVRVGGLTATLYRLGQGMLTDPGGIWQDVCLDLTGLDAFNWFLDMGYLAWLTPKPTVTEYDISGVGMRGGEFIQQQLQAAVDREALTRAAVAEMLAEGADRRHWLVFAAGTDHCDNVARVLAEYGIPCASVHTRSPGGTRAEAVKAFKRGQIRALVNNGIFTTGFDFPGIDLISVLRHTASPGLWVQMLGRGTRPVWPTRPGELDEWGDPVCNWHLFSQDPRSFDLSTREGRLGCIQAGPKRNCKVLDFARNTTRCGPVNDPVIPRKRGKGAAGAAPVKTCGPCGTWNHTSARFCCCCQAEFPVQARFEGTAGTDELIRGPKQPEAPQFDWFQIHSTSYYKNIPKDRRPPSLRVVYRSGVKAFTEWVCLEHGGPAGDRARQWWLARDRMPGQDVPSTIDEAMARLAHLREPKQLKVLVNKTPQEILYCDLEGTAN